MLKKIAIFLVVLLALFLAPISRATENSFVTVINPVRGSDFWDLKDQTPQTAVSGQMEILKKSNVPATWLVRVDSLKDKNLINTLKNAPPDNELGLFLEVTPTWAQDANVTYRKSEAWHFAGSVLLTGYDLGERQKLVETAFEEFKNTFGYYPKSIGAWWVDSFSTNLMQNKYGIEAVLIVADQYSTDNYQIWGQYWEVPYYPSYTNMLNPAQTLDSKIPIVVTQWAARDPIGGFGKGVEESTLSVQANDYIDYHNLDINYFEKLVDIYTNQNLNSVNQLVVGLENSYSWKKYSSEYQKQIELLAKKRSAGQFSLVTQSSFANWYKNKFPEVSPTQVLVTNDPLGSDKKAVWFMNPYYRAGFIYSGERTLFRDIRQYINGTEELCLKEACSEINFATFATRVLDEVTKGNRWVLDEGQISNFKVDKNSNSVQITYTNTTGKNRVIELMPRDISVDGKTSSIDSAILQASADSQKETKTMSENYFKGVEQKSNSIFLLEIFKFILFVIFAFTLPGFVLISIFKLENFLLKVFLATCIGIVALTLVFYFSSLLQVWWLSILYILLMLTLFTGKKLYREINLNFKQKWGIVSLILAGTIFQAIPVVGSGGVTKYGISFWGPNGHDGIWHIALVKQILEGLVPNNPIFAGETLKNYHYFYDLLVAATSKLGFLYIDDLIFRFYPVLFSLGLGVGTYYLCKRLFNLETTAIFAIYLAYFAGSFGWIVEFIRERHFGGESAFWSNQPISFNLNPPFAISLILLIAFIYLLSIWFEKGKGSLILTMILGSLVAFKAYGAILGIGALMLLIVFSIIKRRNLQLLKIFIGAVILSVLILIPNYGVSIANLGSSGIFTWSPFWFVHSMIDSPDRVGLTRLTLTRTVGFAQGNIIKIVGAESIGLLIFWIGNLGVRAVSFALLIKPKKLFQDLVLLYIFFLSVLALVIPLFFIQVGNPWNSIQFFYYGLYTTAIFSGLVLSWMVKKGTIFKLLVIIFLVIAPINSFLTASGYIYPIPHTALSFGEKNALDFLSKQEWGRVLTYPFEASFRQNLSSPIPLPFYETTAYVAAFSGKQTYLEDTIQQEILQTDYQQRHILQSYFFKDFDENKKKVFLADNNIKYIYLPKIFGVSIPVDKLNLKIIYQNDSVTIYEVTK